MHNVFNHLLVSLCLADLLVILTNLALALRTLNPGSSLLYQLAPWTDGLCHIGVSCSVFLTVSITLERYYAVCSPIAYQARMAQKGHSWILITYISPVILISICLNTPKLLNLSNILSLNSIPLEHHHLYIKLSIMMQVFHPLLTTCIIPIIILIILNYKIYSGSRRFLLVRPNTSDISLAHIMMTIVAVFIILSVPKMAMAIHEVSTIPSILDCFSRQCGYFLSSSRWIMDILVRYLVMLNSSTNFLIYCFVGSNFRQTLVKSMNIFLGRVEDVTEATPASRASMMTPPRSTSVMDLNRVFGSHNSDLNTVLQTCQMDLKRECAKKGDKSETKKAYLETDF